MRKKRKSEDGGFNVWRSYSDMMAGVLLLFVLIMCVTLFQAQKMCIRDRYCRLGARNASAHVLVTGIFSWYHNKRRI